jgi:glutamate racemase
VIDSIGVFDSGVGGLTVVTALRRRLPRESILYLGDTARLPYGSKSPETVTRYTRRNIEFLTERGVKAVVVACNTASALALPNLDPQVPTWGVIEPGARKAAAVSRGKVGIIATEATVRSDAYARELRRLRPELEILSRPCPLLVPLVEEGWHDDPITEEVAQRYLEPLLAEGIDTLVLGCTHYPFVAPLIASVAGPGVTLINPAAAVARELRRRLAELQLLAPADRAGATVFRTSGTPEHLAAMLAMLGVERGPVAAL